MHIVTLGSGTGQATLLRGLRAYPCEVTAIVGVTDNGGHSGHLRRLLHIPQVGDTRQCLSALADATTRSGAGCCNTASQPTIWTVSASAISSWRRWPVSTAA